MPTGYTADLEKRNYDVKGWLKENVIRAMGVCIALRDEGEMGVENILKALKKTDVQEPYHEKRLKEARAELAELMNAPHAVLKKKFEHEMVEAEADFKARKQEYDEKSAKHRAAINEVEDLQRRALVESASELVRGTLKFAHEQLSKAYSFDYGSGPFRREILDLSFEQWLENRRKRALRDIDYHSRESAKETARDSDRYVEYKKFIEFIDEKKEI